MYKRILVATDGSPLSKKAVDGAIGLASALGADLVALKVVPRYPESFFEGSLGLAAQDAARVEKLWAENGQAIVDAVKQKAELAGLRAKAVTLKSDLVAESVLATAKKHKCDLVVMASHGRRGLKRILMGSETQKVLTHAHLPVLVLR